MRNTSENWDRALTVNNVDLTFILDTLILIYSSSSFLLIKRKLHNIVALRSPHFTGMALVLNVAPQLQTSPPEAIPTCKNFANDEKNITNQAHLSNDGKSKQLTFEAVCTYPIFKIPVIFIKTQISAFHIHNIFQCLSDSPFSLTLTDSISTMFMCFWFGGTIICTWCWICWVTHFW